MHYKISNGADSPYAATILGNLGHWLNEATEIRNMISESSEKGELYEPEKSSH